MKSSKLIWLIGTILFFISSPFAHAIPLGINITIPDKVFTDTGWYGYQEDQEVEPNCLTGQEWDMEGLFLKGNTLIVVGGFNMKDGIWDPLRPNNHYRSGDIFIDIDGNVKYGPDIKGSGSGNNQVKNSFGYDYVVVLDFIGIKYSVYSINNDSKILTVTFSQNDTANPWRYDSGGTFLLEGVLSYYENLTDSEVGNFSGGNHYAASISLSFLPPGQKFTAHYTYQCGNDNLMGMGTTVPAPTALLLIATGLIGLAGIGRSRFKKG